MPPYPLTNFEIQKILLKGAPIFNSVFSRNNLSKIKDETYIITPDKYKSIGTH